MEKRPKQFALLVAILARWTDDADAYVRRGRVESAQETLCRCYILAQELVRQAGCPVPDGVPNMDTNIEVRYIGGPRDGDVEHVDVDALTRCMNFLPAVHVGQDVDGRNYHLKNGLYEYYKIGPQEYEVRWRGCDVKTELSRKRHGKT